MISKCYKKESKTNFEGTYFRNGRMDSAQIQNLGCPILRKFVQKNSFVSVQGVSDASKRCFLYSTLVSRVPGFLGQHNTLPCTVTQATIIEAIVHFRKSTKLSLRILPCALSDFRRGLRHIKSPYFKPFLKKYLFA